MQKTLKNQPTIIDTGRTHFGKKILEKSKMMPASLDVVCEGQFYNRIAKIKGICGVDAETRGLKPVKLAVRYFDGYEDNADEVAQIYIRCMDHAW